jgi:hypothetical protein
MKSGLEHQRLEIGLTRQIDDAENTLSQQFNFAAPAPPDEGEVVPNMGVNYIDNSDMDFSTDAYLNAVPVGDDTADECFNFYRQRFIRLTDAELSNASVNLDSVSAPFSASYTYPMPFFALSAGTSEKALVGTITRVSDTRATMSAASQADITDGIVFFGETYAETAAKALKSSDHSLFAAETANDSIPRWDETAGQAEIGGDGADNFDLAIPLPFNLATRGLDFFFSVNMKLRSGAAADNPMILYLGVYDTTAGNEKFLEADNFDLSVFYFGTAGTKTYECVVIGTFFNGEQVASDVVTVTNVSDTLDADNYLDWNWENAPRVLDFALYRKDTATGDIVRVFTIYNGETRFFDKNTEGEETVLTFPTAPARREYAYAESLPFIPTAEFRRIPIYFRVPPTYLQSATTARQILRIGLYNHAANDTRPLVIDRVLLTLPPQSVWNRSSRDLERVQTTAPTSGDPDGNQGGGYFCFTGRNAIFIKRKPSDEWQRIDICDAERGMWIYNGRDADRITDVKIGYAKDLYRVELANDITLECTASERFITSPSDRRGTPLDRLTPGNAIQTVVGGMSYQGKIKKIERKTYLEAQKVYTLSLLRDKIFVVGDYRPRWWKNPIDRIKRPIAGALAHNRKFQDYNIE